MRWGVSIDEACNLYGSYIETVEHILRNCQKSSRLWFLWLLRLVVDCFASRDIGNWLASEIVPRRSEALEQAVMLPWSFWRSINQKIFEDSCFDPWAMVSIIISTYQDYKKVAVSLLVENYAPTQHARQWKPLSEGRVKLNSDLAVFDDGSAGFGAIFRDYQSNVLMGTIVWTPTVSPPPEGETQAII